MQPMRKAVPLKQRGQWAQSGNLISRGEERRGRAENNFYSISLNELHAPRRFRRLYNMRGTLVVQLFFLWYLHSSGGTG